MIPPAYYRSLLSAREQEGYRIMVNELLQYRSEVTLPFSVTEGDSVFRILNAVHKDHPEIFYIDYWQRYKLCGVLHQAQSTLPLRYLMDQRRAEAVLNTINNKVKRLDPIVAKQRNLKDKYYVIVRYIASSVSYKDTNSAFWDHTAAGPLIGRAAVCEGISKLFLLICQRLNLPCALVGGTLHNQPHAWNMVEPQEGDIRYLDVTGLLRLATIPEFLCPDIAYKTEQSLRKGGYILDA